LFGVCSAADKLELKDRRIRRATVSGINSAKPEDAGLDINLDVYTSAIRDALAGKASTEPGRDSRDIMDLQKRPWRSQKAVKSKRQEPAEARLS